MSRNMKSRITNIIVASALFSQRDGGGQTQGTAFTYQGRLDDTGQCANGNYGFQFALYGAPTGGSALYANLTDTSDVLVSNGLYSLLTLDFGAGVFSGNIYYLQTSVRTNTQPARHPTSC